MTPPDRPAVRNRLVVHIHGYQLTAPERFHRRFVRDLSTFGKTWSLETETGPADIRERHARWEAKARGPGWDTRADYRILRLDDLIEIRHREPVLTRMRKGLAGLTDFLVHRALIRYFRYGWRYAIFTLVPLAMLLGAALVGLAAGWALAALAGTVLGALGGALAFAAALAFAGRRMYLFTLLEDWAFASVLVRGLEPEIARRIEEARRDVQAAIDGGAYDEVLLIGHSLGAALILHLAAALLDGMPPEPGPGPRRPRIAVLTIGSSVLKIALHSAAHGLRRATATVTASPRVVWAEYWSPQDVMNFPRVDPAAAMGVSARFPPIFRKAVFRQMIDPEAFRKLRFDFFRKHNLFFHAATRRSVYDYFMFVAGPFFAADLFREKDGAMNWIDGTGALMARAPRAATGEPAS